MSIVFHHSKHSAQRRFRTPETATFFNHATAQTEEQATVKRLNANANQAATSRNLHARKKCGAHRNQENYIMKISRDCDFPQ